MENKMYAVVKERDGKDGWSYKEVDRIAPEDDEVEIKVKCIGICGSELHMYHDNHFYTPGTVVGHEFAGEISRVGKNVKGWEIGDRVVAQMDKGACGDCDYCKKGLTCFCPNGKAVGYDIDGGWAEYYRSPAKFLLKLPDNVSYEEGSMVEPCNVVCQALIVQEAFNFGDIVLVQGCGTIGMLSAMLAKSLGAQTVILTGTDVDEDIRLPIAREIDAIDYVVNVQKQDLKEIVMEVTEGKGVDLIVEASGAEAAITNITENLRKLGKIAVLGETAKDEITINWNQTLFKSCDILFSFGEVFEAWDIAIKILKANKPELEKLITHRFELSEFHKGFEALENKTGLKVLLIP